MKQTNNAIKFLMAQYRAIFKNAYFKGMATALVLTAGLAAGSAQAAHYYIQGSTVTDWTYEEVTAPDTLYNNGGFIAGSIGGDFTIGGEPAPSDSASNGVLHVGNAFVSAIQDIVSISGPVYGGYASGNGQITAENNTVYFEGTANVKNYSSGSGDAFGGKAVSTDGVAIARGNQIVFNDNINNVITIDGRIIVNHAVGNKGAIADGNGVENDISITLNDDYFGGLAEVSGTGTNGDFSALNNIVNIETGTEISGTGLTIGAGGVNFSGATGTGTNTISATNNELNINTAITDGKGATFVGNYISGDTAVADTITATSGKVNVNETLTSGSVYGAQISASGSKTLTVTGNEVTVAEDAGINGADGMIAGANVDFYANAQKVNVNISQNKVTIEGSSDVDRAVEFSGGTVYGAALNLTTDSGSSNPYNNLSGSTVSLSDNIVTIGTNVSNLENVYGAYYSGGSRTGNANITLSGNKVTLNSEVSGTGTAGASATDGLIVAAFAKDRLSVTGEKTLTLSNNTVEITGEDRNARDGDELLSINKATIAGAFTKGTSNYTTNTIHAMNNNTVRIGSNVHVKDSVIWASNSSGSTLANIQTLNNNVTVAGNSIIENTVITGGAGANSAVTLDDGSFFIVSDDAGAASTTSGSIISDVINLNGSVVIGDSDKLSLSGYYQNGAGAGTALNVSTLTADDKFNPNQTTIGATAKIYNKGELQVLGTATVADGAQLIATKDGAAITIDGGHVESPELDTTSIYQKDDEATKYDGDFDYVNHNLAVLNISSQTALDYLHADSGDNGYYILPGQEDVEANQQKYTDSKGTFKLADNGEIHFTDTNAVELGSIQNDDNEEIGFVFGSGAGYIDISGTANDDTVDGVVSAAAITVSKPLAFAAGYNPSTSMGDTVIKADSLVIGDGRAETNETAYTKLSQFITSGTGATAKVAPIAFMSNGDITLDADAISNSGGIQAGNTGNSFTIDSDLYLQNNNANITANINGDDLIVDLQGKSFYIAGNYQTSSDITVEDAGEGEFAIGKVISDKDVSGVENNDGLFEGTTNVKLNGQLINKTTASNDATILVQGHGSGEVNPTTNPRTFYDHHATLDLTSATLATDKAASGALFLKASGDATIKMNASQVNTILAGNIGDAEPNTQKFGIVLAGETQPTTDITDGKLDQNGTVNELYPDNSVAILDLAGTGALTAQFDDFVALGSTGSEGTVNKIALNANALIIADSADLSNRANNRNGEILSLQGAELRVDSLTVSNYNLGNQETLETTEAEITNGTYTVANSLTSANGSIKVGDGADVVLGNANVSTGTVGKNLNIDGTAASVTVQNGAWTGNAVTIADGSMTVAGSQVFDPEADEFAPASFTGTALTMTGGSLNVGDSAEVYRIDTDNSIYVDRTYDGAGNVTFTTADISRGSVNIGYGSTLTLLGDAAVSGAGIDYANDTINVNSGTLVFGEAATAAMYTAAADGTVDVADGFGEINLRNYGTVQLTFAQGTNESFTAAEATSLKEQLFSSDSFTGDLLWGTLNVGNAGLDIEGLGTGSITWAAFKPFADMASDVTSNELLQTTVTGVGADGDSFRGQVGSVIAAEGINGLTIDNTTTFNHAAGNNGHFATTSTGADLALTVQNGQLKLANGGIAGAITLNNSADLNIDSPEAETIVNGDINGATGDVLTNGPVTVNGNVNVDDLEVNGGSFTSGVIADTKNQGNITANWAGVFGGSLTTNNLTVYDLEVAANEHGQASTVTVADTVTINDTAEIIDSSSLTAYNVQLEEGATVAVGISHEKLFDAESNTFKFDRYAQSTGNLQADIFGLNGGTLAIDPAYGQAASLAAIGRFDNDKIVSATETTGGTIQGQILIGMNGALGVGTTLDDLKASLADWNLTDENGSLDANKYGAALVVGNVEVKVDNGSGILLTTQSLYGTDGTKEGGSFLRSDTVTKAAASTGLTSSGVSNGMYMGDNTVTVFDVNSEGKNGSITFANNDAKLIADGGEVLVTGNVRARTPYKLFADGNGGVAVVNTSGTSSTSYTGAEDDVYITVTTLNGLLQGVLYGNDAGTVELQLNQNYRSILSGASDPVTESIAAYATGYNDWQDAEADRSDELVGTTLTKDYTTYVTENGSDEGFTGQKYENYNNYFLNNTLITGNGAAAETVARLAIYGGAAQAAISAGASTYDAVSGRMGVGANGANITVADNTQGTALWLAPIYKSSDSDGFEAEGVDYGVDMDLYGVALGADYTLSNGIRFGAMFNVGSGDVDGQGAGAGVSNDFDYYGFAVYGGYSMGALSLVADVSYTVADNDLEGNTAIDKVGATLDSTNLSLGVTGQYQLDFYGTSVTPHAGLRFSRIDLDDYSVDGEGVIANYDADSMNIFSIPVGVTFAKEFVGDAWTVKPSLDLTLTGNFGDDETDGTVHWAGVQNLSTNVSSEVIDNFTYGATLGVAAKTGNFSLGLGVNYTGSSNVDEFGVQANARFVF